MPQTATAFAPASIANVGPGFDVLGFALCCIGDKVALRRIDERIVRMDSVTGDGGALPLDTEKNIAGAVVRMMWEAAKPHFGIAVTLQKGLPLGSGLGSSAASAAAAVRATQALLDDPFTEQELLLFCGRGEAIASGSVHYDNVAASFLGGMIRVTDAAVPIIEHIPVPDGWHVAIAHPDVVISTAEARAALPPGTIASAPAQLASRVEVLVAAFAAGDIVAAGKAIMDDPVITPHRLKLIPHAEAVIAAALAAGATSVSISGSGPTLFALTDGAHRAKVVADAMREMWRNKGISCDIHTSPVGGPGAELHG
jgi:homoserine kinase